VRFDTKTIVINFGGKMRFRFPLSWILLIVGLTIGLVACGGSDSGQSGDSETEQAASVPSGDAANGKTLFDQVCFACHGEGGVGIEGLGKDMTTSTFIAGSSDEELLAFVKVGRPVGDPANTTNVDMPPKGGNPALSDDDLRDIIAYIRTIQK
jgi:mono/diheme cytochrome c family protein